MTTYSAQGTTVDRAFVARRSVDGQAGALRRRLAQPRARPTSTRRRRSRAHREEIAPASRRPARGLPHIAEAAERDRAQLAAHDVAQLEGLPSEQLRGRRKELDHLASSERSDQQRRENLAERIERAEDNAKAPGAPGRHAAEALEHYRTEMDTLPPISHEARDELAAVREVLAARERLAVAATRITPPPYILAELGQRPSNPSEARAWDRGAGIIESYRCENGVSDHASAFGPPPQGGAAQARQRKAIERTARLQRQLREVALQKRVKERSVERSFGISR